jgi:hypothetical protein
MKAPFISVDPRKLVYVSENHGGYLGLTCRACNASGWKNDGEPGIGLPHGSKHPTVAVLIHEPECPVGAVLDAEGKFSAPSIARSE